MRLSMNTGLSAPGGSLRTVLASLWSFSANWRCDVRGWKTHGDNHVCLKLFRLSTFAGNFRADYFPTLTDGAIKRSWVRNLEKFQGCLCFSSCWISQFVSLRLSTWKYGTQLIRMRWRQLKGWLELSLNGLLEISLVLHPSRVNFTVCFCA